MQHKTLGRVCNTQNIGGLNSSANLVSHYTVEKFVGHESHRLCELYQFLFN